MAIQCDICNRIFNNNQGLASHRRWHDLPENKDFLKDRKQKIVKAAKLSKGMTGKTHSLKTKKIISQKLKGNRSDGHHPRWKGNAKLSYHYLHKWIREHKPQPERCEECGIKKDYLELANISGEYKRDINDYKYLCFMCHMKFDKRWEKFQKAGENTRFKEGHKNELRWNKN